VKIVVYMLPWDMIMDEIEAFCTHGIVAKLNGSLV
jgi:hypothetical protein